MKAARRKKLPKSKFASPKGQAPNKSKNQYPVDTRGRAVNAKARATQMVKKGKLSKSKAAQIKAKANRALKRMGKKKRRR
jgi:hypothetical protein